MAVLKYYDGSDWEPVASALVGPTGSTGTTGPTGPTGSNAVVGLSMVVPTGVAVGSGSGSVDANGAVTFSGASSISLNGCFNSTYDNYKVELVITAITSGPYVQLRFRDGTGDISGANYGYRQKNLSSAGTGFDTDELGRTQTIAYLIGQTLGETFVSSLDIFSPNLAEKTHGVNLSTVQVGNALVGAFAYNTTAQFTGFSIIASTGNFTGTIRVYGYKN